MRYPRGEESMSLGFRMRPDQRHDACAALVAFFLRVAPTGSPMLDLAGIVFCLLLSLLLNAPLTTSPKAEWGEGLLRDLVLVLSQVFFANERFRDGELPEDSSSSVGVSTSLGQHAPFLYYRRLVAHHGHYLVRLCDFFLYGLSNGNSRILSARLNLATLSSILLVPLTFSILTPM